MSTTPTITMNFIKSKHDMVVEKMVSLLEPLYTVLTNIEKEEHIVASMFPDIVLKNKQTGIVMYIMEVRENGEVAKCLQQWKTVPNIPAILYIVVPVAELPNAKSVVQAIGIQARFGSYEIQNDGEIKIDFN